ncbi:cupredoxin domain-containing protein [Colwellia sp. 4_MG-2023]|jgi:hypothetical protein|uniref:cupredoxin domain-containing protein n=1 Tax=unclassified Colwellia TaxID=196834 RepID=UPI001C0A48BD|nr:MULTISPECIES: cupredoxin domain-containing protein [unclassified Colwellia]MBU2923387.1 cupredoxin domain-containing protein [Colwellia sp. C2M11]MDO6486978.1 cupredoxin domain-containing protein [Colwellia sp. 6_MG-2023]MDO6508012.1 cupredoxin domain-containing protein [Colwellia sp. 5_MG-2023]MDO6556807.1 cupredoxin domain-containing protein [Colwellia sp. 4_MG-2023]MDO6653747.1 cupredoxin domain-containing protein [Colwellia sp. 3_MG-2023]
MDNIQLIRYLRIVLVSLLLLLTLHVQAQKSEYHIKIKNHLFYPAVIVIPANKKIKLVIDNHDENIEEFDSFDLNREKVIFPNKQASIFIGPLPVGEYSFFGEYHPHSARGKVIVVESSQQKLEKGKQDAN